MSPKEPGWGWGMLLGVLLGAIAAIGIAGPLAAVLLQRPAAPLTSRTTVASRPREPAP